MYKIFSCPLLVLFLFFPSLASAHEDGDGGEILAVLKRIEDLLRNSKVPTDAPPGSDSPGRGRSDNDWAQSEEEADNLLERQLLDEDIRETIEIRGDFPPIDVHIRGRNRDIVSVDVDGQEKMRERLYNIARDPGTTTRSDFHWRTTSHGAIIGFRWGRNDDLMYAIAVVDNQVVATDDEYWKHSSRNVSVRCRTDSLIQFTGGGEIENLRLVGSGSSMTWKREAPNE